MHLKLANSFVPIETRHFVRCSNQVYQILFPESRASVIDCGEQLPPTGHRICAICDVSHTSRFVWRLRLCVYDCPTWGGWIHLFRGWAFMVAHLKYCGTRYSPRNGNRYSEAAIAKDYLYLLGERPFEALRSSRMHRRLIAWHASAIR